MVGGDLIMSSKHYEVVYIDKFSDIAKAEMARDLLRQRFHLDDLSLDKLSCGQPVVVKRLVPLDDAQKFESAIKQAGGTCWVQEVPSDGVHTERRELVRRQKIDRRGTYRGSSILPDRRQSCGRRSSDRAH